MGTEKSSKKLKLEAQDLLMHQIAKVGYGTDYDEYVASVGSQEKAETILMGQMNRIAKMFGYEEAWFE